MDPEEGERVNGTNWESSIDMYSLLCMKQTASGRLPCNAGSSAWWLCDDLGGWDQGVGGRLKKEEIYVYLQSTHLVVQQKLT